MERYNCDPPSLTERLFQRQTPEKLLDQNLNRCLNLFDLIAQGLAHIIGGGIFVITPAAVSMIAGPGLGVSYIIASFIIFLTVLCYMDLGSKFECIGNAYVYVYTSIGEFPAILVATFMCGEMTLALPMISHGVAQNLDATLFNNSIHETEAAFINSIFLTSVGNNVYSITILVLIIAMIINLIGIKEVTVVNSFIVTFSVCALIMYCTISAIHGDVDTFSNSTNPKTGKGGVFPYGWQGVLQGAAVSVVAYVGFETVVALAAEAKEPKRDIPRATCIAFLIVASLFTSVAFAISYMTPWYQVSTTTGLADTLKYRNFIIPMYIMAAAVVLACFSSTLCNLTTVVRALYVLAIDGLLFAFLGAVADKTKVPHVATFVVTIISIILSIIFTFKQLIHMVSGGALMIFIIVNITVIVISYRKTPVQEETPLVNNELRGEENNEGEEDAKGNVDKIILLSLVYLVVVIIALVVVRVNINFVIKVISVVILLAIAFGILLFISLKFELDDTNQLFRCPLVPFVPGLAIVLNVLLLTSLDNHALKMIGIYGSCGVVLYLCYGVFHSTITYEKQKLLRTEEFDETEGDLSDL